MKLFALFFSPILLTGICFPDFLYFPHLSGFVQKQECYVSVPDYVPSVKFLDPKYF